jgi:ribulose-phosphate 3-epimerase
MEFRKTHLLAPSLLAANFGAMGQAVSLIETSGADWVHLDVMDGQFVPNISFGPKMIADLRPLTDLVFDTHLMVNRPDHLLKAFADAGSDYITIHLEATNHPHRSIQNIHSLGKKAGISIVPSTPVDHLTELLPSVDLVLIMTVNPGFGGQELIEHSLKKVSRLVELRKAGEWGFLISVDGGVNRITAPLVRSAGADILVAGSAFFRSGNPVEEIALLKGISDDS